MKQLERAIKHCTPKPIALVLKLSLPTRGGEETVTWPFTTPM